MRQFGAFEAKTHFSEILADVINGEKFIITKHGVQVAMIVPFFQEKEQLNPVKDAIRAIENLSKDTTLGENLSVKKLIEKGRK